MSGSVWDGVADDWLLAEANRPATGDEILAAIRTKTTALLALEAANMEVERHQGLTRDAIRELEQAELILFRMIKAVETHWIIGEAPE